MLKKSSRHINDIVNFSLKTVGDMALKRRAKKIIEGINSEIKDKILEIGCGNGYYLSLFNRLDLQLDLTGIDIDQSAISDAKRFINDKKVKLIIANATKLPFKSDSFDKVIMSEVIEHVDDEKEVLSEAARVLRKGGIMTLTTCNINYPFLWDPINWILQHFFRTHIKAGFWAGIWNQHSRLYKKQTIENLVKKSGLRIEKVEELTFWCLPFNHYIVNLIAKLFYANKLPKSISRGINKFKNHDQPFLIKVGFNLINLFDKLNDKFPQKSGVSIFIKASKN